MAPAGEAASAWRTDKLKDFAWRLRCLGMDQDPEFASILAQIGEHTTALEEMWEQQKQQGYERPWWADGEYDAARADRCACRRRPRMDASPVRQRASGRGVVGGVGALCGVLPPCRRRGGGLCFARSC